MMSRGNCGDFCYDLGIYSWFLFVLVFLLDGYSEQKVLSRRRDACMHATIWR